MIQCMCRGYYKPHTINKIMKFFGVNDLTLENLRIYQCDKCGKEIFPEKTIEKINKIQKDFFEKKQGQLRELNQLDPIFL